MTFVYFKFKQYMTFCKAKTFFYCSIYYDHIIVKLLNLQSMAGIVCSSQFCLKLIKLEI